MRMRRKAKDLASFLVRLIGLGLTKLQKKMIGENMVFYRKGMNRKVARKAQRIAT